MEQALFTYLSNTLSSDNNLRNEAELKLKELQETQIEYASYLAKILNSSEYEIGLRQSAGVALKNYIKVHWSPSESNSQVIQPSSEVKAIVRELAFKTLGCPHFNIRSSAALVVAKLAHYDWPEDWPDFCPMLLKLIILGDRDGVHGGLKAFSEFASNDLSDQQVSTIGPVLLPELYKIVVSEGIYTAQTKIHAIEVFHRFVDMVHVMKDSNKELEGTILTPILPMWLDYFTKILSAFETNLISLSFCIEICSTLYSLAERFPRQLINREIQLITLLMNGLQQLAPIYVAEEIHANDIPDSMTWDDKYKNELEYKPSIEAFVYGVYDFITALISKKIPTAKNALLSSPDFLPKIVWITILFHQLTDAKIDEYKDDPNSFLEDEDMDTLNYSVRIASMDFILRLVRRYESEALKALSTAASLHLQEATRLHQTKDPNWWLIVESTLACISYVSYEVIELYETDSKEKPIDIEALFNSVVLPLMPQNEQPFAQGRAFVFASQYASLLPQNLALQCLDYAIQNMKSSPSIIVNVSGLKAVNNFCTTLKSEIVLPLAESIFMSTFTIANVVKNEMLSLLIDTWISVVGVSHEITAKVTPHFIPIIMNIWAANAESDHLISEQISELILKMASNPLAYPTLLNLIVPGLVKMISDPKLNSTVASAAIDILTSLVSGGPSLLPAGFIEMVLPPVLSCYQVEDPQLHTWVQDFLLQVVLKDLDKIIEWQWNGQSGLFYVIKFIVDMLSENRNDASRYSIGTLILTLLLKNSEVTLPYLPEILPPLINCLIKTEMPSARQNLIIVIAQLCRTHLDLIVDFLSKPMANINNPLETIIQIWTENHEYFSGYFQIKLSALALSNLFVKNDPRIEQITCKGKMVDINPGKIVTRSQTKKAGERYVQLPAPVKILSLLLGDYRNDTYNTELNALEYDDDYDEEDYWEDVEEGLLSDQLQEHKYPTFEEESFKLDPLYNYDLKGHLKQLFQKGLSENLGNLQGYANSLEPQDRETLKQFQ